MISEPFLLGEEMRSPRAAREASHGMAAAHLGIPRLLFALLLLLAASVIVHFALFTTPGDGGTTATSFLNLPVSRRSKPSSEPNFLCLSARLQDSTSLLAVAPLFNAEIAPADALAARLATLLLSQRPCSIAAADATAASVRNRPALIFLVDAAAPLELSDELSQLLRRREYAVLSERCFGSIEVRRLPAATAATALNDAFLYAFSLARERASALLWLAPESVPLRARWLEVVQCERLQATPGAWIVGSANLMDCHVDWEPPASCCAEGDPRLSSRHLSATGLYAAHDAGFQQYVLEWNASTLRGAATDAPPQQVDSSVSGSSAAVADGAGGSPEDGGGGSTAGSESDAASFARDAVAEFSDDGAAAGAAAALERIDEQEVPFHAALSVLLWSGWHESRQRYMRRSAIRQPNPWLAGKLGCGKLALMPHAAAPADAARLILRVAQAVCGVGDVP